MPMLMCPSLRKLPSVPTVPNLIFVKNKLFDYLHIS